MKKLTVWVIAHKCSKAKTAWLRLLFGQEIEFNSGDKINCGRFFFREKDAKLYIKAMTYPDLYEVIKLTD